MQARGNIEAWLGQVEQSMAVCLRKLARAGYQTYPNQARTQWVTQQPSQLVLLISQVQFASRLSFGRMIPACKYYASYG